jgi:hypothetical protein
MASAALLFKAAGVKASFSCGHTDITCATPHPLALRALPCPLFEGSGLGRFHSEYRVGSGLRRFLPRAEISRGRAKSAEIFNGDDRRTKFTRNATGDKGEYEEGRRGVRAEQDNVQEEKPKRRRASPRAKKTEEAKVGVPQAKQVKKDAQALKSAIKRVEKKIKMWRTRSRLLQRQARAQSCAAEEGLAAADGGRAAAEEGRTRAGSGGEAEAAADTRCVFRRLTHGEQSILSLEQPSKPAHRWE